MNPFKNDGFTFAPKGGQLELSFFDYTAEELNEGKSENEYHIAFFFIDDAGEVVDDDQFDAIFLNPYIYIKNLIGGKYYGMIARKTKRSAEWFDKTLIDIKKALQNAK